MGSRNKIGFFIPITRFNKKTKVLDNFYTDKKCAMKINICRITPSENMNEGIYLLIFCFLLKNARWISNEIWTKESFPDPQHWFMIKGVAWTTNYLTPYLSNCRPFKINIWYIRLPTFEMESAPDENNPGHSSYISFLKLILFSYSELIKAVQNFSTLWFFLNTSH